MLRRSHTHNTHTPTHPHHLIGREGHHLRLDGIPRKEAPRESGAGRSLFPSVRRAGGHGKRQQHETELHQGTCIREPAKDETRDRQQDALSPTRPIAPRNIHFIWVF
jgi:hypothetical protein